MHTKSKEESRFEWQSHNSNLWQILVLTNYISPGEMSMNEEVSDYGNMWRIQQVSSAFTGLAVTENPRKTAQRARSSDKEHKH